MGTKPIDVGQNKGKTFREIGQGHKEGERVRRRVVTTEKIPDQTTRPLDKARERSIDHLIEGTREERRCFWMIDVLELRFLQEDNHRGGLHDGQKNRATFRRITRPQIFQERI